MNETTLKVATKQNKHKGWIQGMDSLRFILALWVVLGHHDGIRESLTLWLDKDQLLERYLIGLSGNLFVGVAAVIIFFIISGIVIHFPYRDGKDLHLFDFLVKRYIRISLPMLVIVAIATPLDFVNPVLWSLYCELIYYTIYPILLIQIRKNGINPLIIISYILVAVFIFLDGYTVDSFIHQIPTDQGYDGNFMYHGVLYTWLIGLPSWLLGVKIAENFDLITGTKVSKSKILMLRASILLISIICSIARFHFSLSYTISLNLFAILAFFWISAEVSYLQKKKSLPWLESAGKWSYSIYLCHMPVFFIIAHYMQGLTQYIQWMISVPAVLVFSYVFYLLLERPSHKLAKGFNKKAFFALKKAS
ncbi:peptidoglycan/LPS O-acetylase OafA/YrhL [Catalinimonas alkaloidigena]|uniref:acyltransferase family protein n=1 Tax=Catalinimonas alkaloidigena TaxID=1075417 RepID=UPI0024053BE9|nr:acyltransferase [Catalinimonas alkaloidigena]MDF9798348.1 peptidoglycan/LPS O-acetylase OafA/YrhL [Catalinimonas alkaloidigena]